MENSKLVAVYGSLRKGEYNYNSFMRMYPKQLEYIKTETISGFKLFNLGSYPGINKGSESDKLVIDLFRVGERAFQSIDMMEKGAGYSVLTLETSEGDATLYLYNHNCEGNREQIMHGDWTKRNEKSEEVAEVSA